MNDLEHDIALLQHWAVTIPIVERVWLFGSRIRGTHNPDSDLDVAVQHGVAPGDSNVFTTGLMEPSKWEVELQPTARLHIDIHPYIPGDTTRVVAGLRQSSRLIYEREQQNDN